MSTLKAYDFEILNENEDESDCSRDSRFVRLTSLSFRTIPETKDVTGITNDRFKFKYEPHSPLFSPSSVISLADLMTVKTYVSNGTEVTGPRFLTFPELVASKKLPAIRGRFDHWRAMLRSNTESDAWNKILDIINHGFVNAEYPAEMLFVDFNKLHHYLLYWDSKAAISHFYVWLKPATFMYEITHPYIYLNGVLPIFPNDNTSDFYTEFVDGVSQSKKTEISFWKLNQMRVVRWSEASFDLTAGLHDVQNYYNDALPPIPVEHAVLSTGVYHVHYYRNVNIHMTTMTIEDDLHNLLYHLLEWVASKTRALRYKAVTAPNLFDIPSLRSMDFWNQDKTLRRRGISWYEKDNLRTMSTLTCLNYVSKYMWYIALSHSIPVRPRNQSGSYKPDDFLIELRHFWTKNKDVYENIRNGYLNMSPEVAQSYFVGAYTASYFPRFPEGVASSFDCSFENLIDHCAFDQTSLLMVYLSAETPRAHKRRVDLYMLRKLLLILFDFCDMNSEDLGVYNPKIEAHAILSLSFDSVSLLLTSQTRPVPLLLPSVVENFCQNIQNIDSCGRLKLKFKIDDAIEARFSSVVNEVIDLIKISDAPF